LSGEELSDQSDGGEISGGETLLERHRWLTFVLPFAVYMLAGALEPSHDSPGGKMLGLSIPYSAYPLVYTAKIALTLAAMAFVLPGYRQFRQRPGVFAVLVGAVGVVVWVGLCTVSDRIGLTAVLNVAMAKVHLYSPRPAYSPLTELAATPTWAWAFLGIRFFGLALVVPVIEEFFLRGFLMRLVMEADWWKVPFGVVNRAAVLVALVWPVLTHQPGEYLAGIAWFGMVTWLMVRTRNPWDCVTAHAVTNLLLGIYVVVSAKWELW
jgi:CAAX prenyl protease-like protein